MDLIPLLVIALPVLTVLAVGLVGSTRRLGFWLSLLLAIVLTPIGGLLVALLTGRKRIERRIPRRPAHPAPSSPKA